MNEEELKTQIIEDINKLFEKLNHLTKLLETDDSFSFWREDELSELYIKYEKIDKSTRLNPRNSF